MLLSWPRFVRAVAPRIIIIIIIIIIIPLNNSIYATPVTQIVFRLDGGLNYVVCVCACAGDASGRFSAIRPCLTLCNLIALYLTISISKLSCLLILTFGTKSIGDNALDLFPAICRDRWTAVVLCKGKVKCCVISNLVSMVTCVALITTATLVLLRFSFKFRLARCKERLNSILQRMLHEDQPLLLNYEDRFMAEAVRLVCPYITHNTDVKFRGTELVWTSSLSREFFQSRRNGGAANR
jgi:hypothetical protein